MAGTATLTAPAPTAIARCGNSTAVNAQLCADVWRNIPEGSGIGAGMWEALKLWWLTFRGGDPPPEYEEVVLNWPEDQLRMLRNTMVQYTSAEGALGRVADIEHINTLNTGKGWKLALSTDHADELVRVEFHFPVNAAGTVLWP